MRVLAWLLVMLALAAPVRALAQDASSDPLADPIVHGAWLYAGNCVRCHGAYAEARLGEGKTSKALKAAISGESRQGCAIDWGIAYGGSLSVKEIGALTAFIGAWEERGNELALPPLPPLPSPTPLPPPTTGAPVEATLLPTPGAPTPTPLPPDLQLALDSNPLARGAWLYAQNCYRCHQDYAVGRMGLGLERDRIERTIQGGKTGSNMPAFAINQGGTLRTTDIKLIVNYIEAFERLDAPPALPGVVRQTMVQPLDPALLAPIALPTAPAVRGDAAHGLLLYQAYCAACHGASEQGGSGPVMARVWDGVRPDLMLRAVVVQGVPGTTMRSWSQAYGGPLDDDAVDDLVAYLLTLPPHDRLLEMNTQTPDNPGHLQGYLPALLLLTVAGAVGLAMFFQRFRHQQPARQDHLHRS